MGPRDRGSERREVDVGGQFIEQDLALGFLLAVLVFVLVLVLLVHLDAIDEFEHVEGVERAISPPTTSTIAASSMSPNDCANRGARPGVQDLRACLAVAADNGGEVFDYENAPIAESAQDAPRRARFLWLDGR